MPRVTVVRYTTKPGQDVENERLSRAVFTELRENAPAHVSYALFRNGSDFMHLFVNTKDDDAAMLVDLPSFKAYVAEIGARSEAPPEQMRHGGFELLEAYGLPLPG